MTVFEIGDRIILSSNLKGILRFIGEINLARGVFYGVELDTPDGKSNGTINEKYYFTCKDKHGLFVRSSQIEKIENETEVCNKSDNKTHKTVDTELISTYSADNKTIVVNNADIQKVDKELILTCLADNKNLVVNNTDMQKDSNDNIANICLPVSSNIQGISTLKQRSVIPRGSLLPINRQTNAMKTHNNENKMTGIVGGKIIPTDSYDLNNKDKIVKTVLHNEFSCKTCSAIEKDCEEKISTLRLLKKKDLEKRKVLEEANIDLVARLSEATNLSERLRKENEITNHKFDTYRETMESMEEAMESITVDKEVAEEDLELHRDLVKELKENIEKLVKENKELTNAVNGKGLPSEDSFIINKYRSAIVDLSQIIDNLKVEIETKDRELELLLDKQISMETENYTIQTENLKSKKDIQELKEIVDSIADSEYIIDNLTEKNIRLETEMAIMEKRVLELDEMNDMSRQNLEDKICEIKQLRSDNDVLDRTIETMKNEISFTVNRESENTDLNSQFREKIQNLETEISTLKLNLQFEKTNRTETRTSTVIRVPKKSFYETKPKMIDGKLRDLELKQKVQLSNILRRYLIDTFDKSQDYMDMIEIVLLVDRYSEKITIILTNIDEMRNVSTINTEVKIFHSNLEFLLLYWQSILNQLKRNVYECELNSLSNISSHFLALKSHEQRIDLILNWIQKDSFDETRDLQDLAASVDYFRCFCQEKFMSPTFDYELKIKNFVKIIKVGSLSLENNILLIESNISKKTDMNIRFKDLTDYMKKFTGEIQTKVKSMYTHLINLPKLELSLDCVREIDEAILYMGHFVQTLSRFSDEITADKISNDNLTSRLLEIFHLNFKTSGMATAKDIFKSVNQIKDTINVVSHSLDHGLFEVIGERRLKNINGIENVIDRSVQKHRETLNYFKRLVTEVEHKDRQIKDLNVELTKKGEDLQESTMSVDHIKSKLRKTVHEKDEELSVMNNKWLKSKDGLNEKEKLIGSLNDEISSLMQQLHDLKNCPVDIEQIEHNDVNNKEGYVTQIRILKNALKILTLKNSQLNSKNIKIALGDLRPISIPTLSNDKATGYSDKAKTLSFDIYKSLSTISIVPLSGNVSKCVRERELAIDTLKLQCQRLKNECTRRNMIVSE